MFDALAVAVTELAALDGDTLSDAELAEALVVLHKQREALAATEARLTRAFDARRVYAVDGARTAAAWLAQRTRSSKQARALSVRLGRATQHMPLTAAAWEAGDISCEHVRQLARARNPRTEEVFARDEHLLVNHATTLPYDVFERSLDR